ncbi:hypothetical protein [uncultured Fibrobacter sp.]|uniref:hypothetical protein n=1 Tax=uncultured Fibrobacter sp. TaxID=261512 RepID=UPI002632E5DF|nr:hypothetical protein [uncultured Fibrobacter sp.]
MIRQKIVSLVSMRSLSVQSVAVAFLMALSVLFFYDPLSGIGIMSWDRSFCEASLAGIDPAKRVSNFYRLYLVYFPLLCVVFSVVVSLLLKGRRLLHSRVSWGISFLALLAAYALREGSPVCNIVANVVAVACFGWQWLLVAFSCRRPDFSKCPRAGPLCESVWESVLEKISAHGLGKVCVIAAFGGVLAVTTLYSKFAVPVLAAHSVWFEKYAERFGFVLSDVSVLFLFLFAFLYVLYFARKSSCDVYRAFVTFIFVSVTLSLLLPVPVVLSGAMVFALLAFLQKKRIDAGLLEFCVFFPLVYCLGAELVFTLLEKGMVGFAPVYGVYAISALFFFSVFFRKGNFRFFPRKIPERGFYAGALLSFVALAYFKISYYHVLPHILEDYQGFYEYGNFLGAIDTLARGKIPVVDYFSAHALCDVFSKIVHGVIHGSYVGALADPYRDFICYSCGGLAFFFVLSKLWGPFFAFSLVCLFPLNSNAFSFVDVCLVALPLHFGLYRKNSVAKFLLFWFLIALLAFYKYDTGIAFGIAALFGVCVLLTCRRDWRGFVKFILSGVSVGVALLCFYFVCCHLNGIDAVARMKEWISLTLHSNPYWALEQLTPMKVSLSFVAAYYFIPLAESFIVYFVVIESFRKRNLEMSAALSLLFSIVGLFLLMRAFVYHTLLHSQGCGSLIFCYGVFALLFFVAHLLKNYLSVGVTKMVWLLLTAVAVWLCNLPNHFIPDSTNVFANRAVSSIASVRSEIQKDIPRMDRFSLDDTLSRYAVEWNTVLSTILTERETFLDFANVPLLYALTERVRPFYSAQSPGLLTDLYSQEMFLKEIEAHEVPVAITGFSDKEYLQSVANVPHHIRYYKIAEYLYSHYRPLVRLGDFVVWCKPERYEDYVRKLGTVGDVALELEENGYEPNGAYHFFDLKQNPYIWANLDKFNAAGNAVLDEAQGMEGRLQFKGSQTYPVSLGNYVAAEIESPEDIAGARILLSESGREQSQYGYAFDLKKGLHKYLVRSSQDYNWFTYNINTVKFSCGACTVRKVQILQGD